MCDPISASIAIGAAAALGSGMQAVGAHQQQQAAVARSNAIAQQQYQRELQIAAQRDRAKLQTYEAELKADTAAKNAYYAQLTANQAEATRALASADNRLEEKRTSAAFGVQRQMAASIQAQGQILSTGKAGQSTLLAALDAERTLGFEMAEIEQTLYDARRASGIEKEGVLLDQNSANIAAWNGLPAAPLAPEASFLPVKPIMASGPSGLALAGSLLGAAADGASSGIGTYKTLKG
jgi:type II secretory pathway component HofQ